MKIDNNDLVRPCGRIGLGHRVTGYSIRYDIHHQIAIALAALGVR